jgi:hypothetical protein
MNIKSFNAAKTRDYAEDVAALLVENEELTVTDAVWSIVDWCIEKKRVMPDNRTKAFSTLYKAYSRQQKKLNEGVSIDHSGKYALTDAEEAVVVGALQGMTRAGEDVTPGTISWVAKTLFPDRSKFGPDWYLKY